jgi:osmotically-inducible protein OsmY
MMTSSKGRLIPVFALAGLVLAACGRPDDDASSAANTQRPQPVDPAVTAADKRADELRADAGRAIQEAKQAATTATERAAETVSDATITAAVNAALAADGKLSAMKIDVDTENGVVTLTGPAPDDEARSRATQLAANAKGVNRVENHLVVKK